MNLTKLASVYADELEYIVTLFSAEGINYNPNELLINIDDAWRAIACYLWLDYDSDNEHLTVTYNGNDYTILKIVDWDSYLIIYIKAVG